MPSVCVARMLARASCRDSPCWFTASHMRTPWGPVLACGTSEEVNS